MSRLTEAGEKISETLFNALVVNGLPGKYEHFIEQESFSPAANFTELRTRLPNFDDSRFQRNQVEEGSATAMNSNIPGRNKGPSKPKGLFCVRISWSFCQDMQQKKFSLLFKVQEKGSLTKSMSK